MTARRHPAGSPPAIATVRAYAAEEQRRRDERAIAEPAPKTRGQRKFARATVRSSYGLVEA